ncbi:hypothetical protein [Deinococcus pimensis]|uniref:hypothetical protein n=1 Tax=Deinococcus pimensis TaxID=309888 RepID=UPI0005EAE3AA|nr:hypothetical protein [Deinococcus pimensis]
MVAGKRSWRAGLGPLATVTVLVLVSFSPSVAWYATRTYDRLQAPTETVKVPDLPDAAPLAPRVTRGYAPHAAAFDATLQEMRITGRRHTRLLERHFELYRQARAVFGEAQANALMRLVDVETRNQAAGLERRSVFSSPEAAIANARDWLAFSRYVLVERPERTRDLAALISSASPVPMAPDVVLRQATWIRRAANDTRLAPGALAAVVDNEQAGASLAYGLSGLLREFTDTAALRATQVYGRSGWTGELSKTVGIAQMSWEDALGQNQRLRAFGVSLGVPFPQNEEEARTLLARPYANLLLTASRIAGYLNRTEGVGPNSVLPHTDAWVYFLGPGWHNNPALASGGETWPYAWNAFFKACLYQRLL